MENNIIKLDYDGFKQVDFLEKIVTGKRYVMVHFKIVVKDVRVFETNKGFHVYIETENNFKDEDLVFIQLALGSDFARECFNWSRIKNKSMGDKWNVLFKKKFAPIKMQEEFLINVSKRIKRCLSYESGPTTTRQEKENKSEKTISCESKQESNNTRTTPSLNEVMGRKDER